MLVQSTESQDVQTNKTTKTSTRAMENVQDESSTHEESPDSDQEQDQEVFFQPSQAQVVMLPEKRQCMNVIAWSGDFGMDQYVSWSLSSEELMLDTIWEKFEEFCMPQSNEVRARFDLLTCFQQGNKSVDECYSAVQIQVALAKYPPETAKILHRDIFWFFLKDEEFLSKTINDNNVDLDKFPANKVRQLAKKMESSKATARHIKQVASDPQGPQINLMRHQCTDLPASKHKKKKSCKV